MDKIFDAISVLVFVVVIIGGVYAMILYPPLAIATGIAIGIVVIATLFVLGAFNAVEWINDLMYQNIKMIILKDIK